MELNDDQLIAAAIKEAKKAKKPASAPKTAPAANKKKLKDKLRQKLTNAAASRVTHRQKVKKAMDKGASREGDKKLASSVGVQNLAEFDELEAKANKSSFN